MILLLDIDGVLQFKHPDCEPGLIEKYEITCDFIQFQYQLFGDPEYSETLVGKLPFLPLLERKLEAAGIDADAIKFMDEWLMGRIEQNQTLLSHVAALSDTTICLATNQEPRRGAHIARHYSRFPFIEHAYMSHQIGIRKPDPDYFHHILDDLKASAEEVVFIDDHPANVEAANQAGVRGIHFKNNEQVIADLTNAGLKLEK